MSMKKHRARQGGHAETHLDTDDQKHLRDVVLEELEAVMRKHKCGGVILINSIESAAWRHVLPEWGGLSDQGHGMRLRISSKTPEAREAGDATLGFIKSIRDFSSQVFSRFDQLWEVAQQQIGRENIHDLYGYSMSDKPKPPEPDENN